MRAAWTEVYRARDTKLGRDVAIKVLPEQLAQSPERLARFEREAQLLASLNHPNIATVHGLEEADGVHYLVMELVSGETLAEVLARGAMSVEDVVAIARQLIDGLEAAHETGIVHRDLKPANIQVTPDGVVRILDFGLAKAFEAEGVEVDSSLSPTITRDGTQAGVIMGTAAYMSPEQARGKRVDKRTDIFAFGSVLFEMLSGKKAFDGEMVSDILAAVIKLEPDWTRLPSTHLDGLVRRCLEKDPRRRLRDIGDARPELEPREAARPPTRGWGASGSAAAAGLVVGLALALAFRGNPSSTSRTEVTRFTIPLPATTRFVNLGAPGFALSPDGSSLAYIRDDELYVRHFDDEDVEPIAGATGARWPFFSADGESIGFITDGEMKRASLSGGPLVTLGAVPRVNAVFGSDWGADGTIVYGERDTGLWRVSSSGGEPELVVKNDGMFLRYPELVDNDTVLLVDVGANRLPEEFQIVAASLSTGERTALGVRGTQPKFVESGHIVFVDQDEVKAVPFDRDVMQVTGAPVSLLDGVAVSGGRQAAPFDVSSSGTLAYLNVASSGPLEWVHRSGETLATVSEHRDYDDVRFSPDGKTVAIMDGSAGVDIWAYDVERETFTRVSHSPGFDEVPIWSPDGRFIAYTTSSIEGSGRVLNRRAADGSGPEEAMWSTPHHAHLGEWIDDGARFLITENRPETGWDVFLLDVSGEPTTVDLLSSASDERNPRLHPSGRWLAYESNESGVIEVYVTSFPEPGARHLVSSGGGDEPVWSRDGRELYYRGPTDVLAVPLQGGEAFSAGRPVPLFSDDRFFRGSDHTTYDVHPDGRFLFVATISKDDELYRGLYRFKIVRNWSAELAARVPAP